MAPQFFLNRRIFENFDISSDNFLTFDVGKCKGFEFYRKMIELGPPFSTGATTPLIT